MLAPHSWQTSQSWCNKKITLSGLTWRFRLLAIAGIFCLTGSSWADEKGSKTSNKKPVFVQIDVSKLPPELVKQLLEHSGIAQKGKNEENEDDDKKGDKNKAGSSNKGEQKGQHEDKDDKKKSVKEDDEKKGKKSKKDDEKEETGKKSGKK